MAQQSISTRIAIAAELRWISVSVSRAGAATESVEAPGNETLLLLLPDSSRVKRTGKHKHTHTHRKKDAIRCDRRHAHDAMDGCWESVSEQVW